MNFQKWELFSGSPGSEIPYLFEPQVLTTAPETGSKCKTVGFVILLLYFAVRCSYTSNVLKARKDNLDLPFCKELHY